MSNDEPAPTEPDRRFEKFSNSELKFIFGVHTMKASESLKQAAGFLKEMKSRGMDISDFGTEEEVCELSYRVFQLNDRAEDEVQKNGLDIDVTDETHAQLEEMARAKGITIEELVSELLKGMIEEHRDEIDDDPHPFDVV